MLIGIRTDANETIASGHITRCLAVGDAMEQKGADVLYLVSDRASAAFLELQGKPYVCLDSRWDDYGDGVDRLLEVMESRAVSALIVDSYYASPEFFALLRGRVKTVYIDDLGAAVYPADMIVNSSIAARRMPCVGMYGRTGTRLLLGCRYAPLRAEFGCRETADSPVEASPARGRDILMTTGGSDPLSLTPTLAAAFLASPALRETTLHIVAGRYCRSREALSGIARQQNIVLHHDVWDMAAMMRRCRAAVSAGGTTLYELCACGVPAAGIAIAGNQLPGLLEFHRRDLVRYCGDAREDAARCAQKALREITSLLADDALCAAISEKQRRTVDGRGAGRIAGAVLRLAKGAGQLLTC